jgi:hypothetical protein
VTVTPRNVTVTGDVVKLTDVRPAAGLVIDENTLTPFSTVLIVAVGHIASLKPTHIIPNGSAAFRGLSFVNT